MTPHTTNEPRNEPCDDCLRWSECNGVDKDYCPMTAEEGEKNE